MESVGDVIKRQTSRFLVSGPSPADYERPRCSGFYPERILSPEELES